MSHSTHSGVHRGPLFPRLKIGIYVSVAVASKLPLYCRDIVVAQERIELYFRRAGHTVVHNKVYSSTDVMSTGHVDMVVLVSPSPPSHIVQSIPFKTLTVCIEGGDVSLYDAVRA